MKAQMTFFPVDNGDMTLIVTESGNRILVDVNIRGRADDPDDEAPDVAAMLRDKLERDADGRLYVDAFLLSHPDQDHCAGLEKHFHLGPPDEWSKQKDRIFIRELWSSPIVFRRAEKGGQALCADAQAFNREARRRVRRHRQSGSGQPRGDQILILGEDQEGKTNGLDDIVVAVDEAFCRVAGKDDSTVEGLLLGPSKPQLDEDEEKRLGKNRSSTILRLTLRSDGVEDACRVLTGGDASVEIWESVWARHEDEPDVLSYDVLQAPHHCSWRSLSHDSWRDEGENAQVSPDARSALGQARAGCTIIASSAPVEDDNDDPPCIRAKREYDDIAGETGEFRCVGNSSPDPIELEITGSGPRLLSVAQKSAATEGTGAIAREPLAHG